MRFGCLPGNALGISIWEREWEGQEWDEGAGKGAAEVLRGPRRISQGTLQPELCCPSGGLRQPDPYDFWKSLDVSYSGKRVWLLSVVDLCSWSIPWRGRKLKVVCTQQAVSSMAFMRRVWAARPMSTTVTVITWIRAFFVTQGEYY